MLKGKPRKKLCSLTKNWESSCPTYCQISQGGTTWTYFRAAREMFVSRCLFLFWPRKSIFSIVGHGAEKGLFWLIRPGSVQFCQYLFALREPNNFMEKRGQHFCSLFTLRGPQVLFALICTNVINPSHFFALPPTRSNKSIPLPFFFLLT